MPLGDRFGLESLHEAAKTAAALRQGRCGGQAEGGKGGCQSAHRGLRFGFRRPYQVARARQQGCQTSATSNAMATRRPQVRQIRATARSISAGPMLRRAVPFTQGKGRRSP